MTVIDVLEGRARWHVEAIDALAFAEALPGSCADAVVMDPPYCSGGFTESAKRQAKGQGLRSETIREGGWFINDAMGTAGLVWLLRCIAVQSFRILREGGGLCVFCDWRMVASLSPAIESAGFRFSSKPVWDKGSAGLGNGFRAQHEEILHFTKGPGRYHRADLGTVLRHNRVHHDEREHQTEKPVGLLADLVTLCAPVDGVVVDFFAGSGSTGDACMANSRRFLGSEIMPANAAKARARVHAAERATTPAADVAGQRTIFDVIGGTR